MVGLPALILNRFSFLILLLYCTVRVWENGSNMIFNLLSLVYLYLYELYVQSVVYVYQSNNGCGCFWVFAFISRLSRSHTTVWQWPLQFSSFFFSQVGLFFWKNIWTDPRKRVERMFSWPLVEQIMKSWYIYSNRKGFEGGKRYWWSVYVEFDGLAQIGETLHEDNRLDMQLPMPYRTVIQNHRMQMSETTERLI